MLPSDVMIPLCPEKALPPPVSGNAPTSPAWGISSAPRVLQQFGVQPGFAISPARAQRGAAPFGVTIIGVPASFKTSQTNLLHLFVFGPKLPFRFSKFQSLLPR